MNDNYTSDPGWAALFAKPEQAEDLRWGREHLVFAAADSARELVTRERIEHWLVFGNAPPPTWPRKELVVDLVHKTVYAVATGVVADALAARSGPGPGQRHAAVRPGRHADVGPLPRALASTPRGT